MAKIRLGRRDAGMEIIKIERREKVVKVKRVFLVSSGRGLLRC